jgi:hypothetical protein
MRFNFGLIVLLALAPLFILFAGLSAAGGVGPGGWEITGLIAAAAFVVAYFARRGSVDDAAQQPVEQSVEAAATEGAEASAAPQAAVTPEDGEEAAAAGYASPACQLHEVDPVYLGYASRDEILALLNELLEAERAGARGAREMSAMGDSAPTRQALHDVARDEARFCAMLFGHITRLGETPSKRTGAFHEKLAALDTLDDRLQLLNRGQGWVVRKLAEAVPTIADDGLRADLQAMLDAHTRNIERCTRLVASSEPVA